MKIVQVGPYPLKVDLIHGGVEASVYGLSQQLSKNNQVSVIDIPRSNVQKDHREVINKLCVYRFKKFGSRNLHSLTRVKAIIKVIKHLQPDIVHLHSTSLLAFCLQLFLLLNRIPVVVTVHGLAHIEKRNALNSKRNWSNKLRYFYQSIAEFAVISLSKELIVDTQYVKGQIEKYKKQSKLLKLPNISVIPQGIDEENFENHLVNQKKKSLISIGAFHPRKGHHLLIEMMSSIQNMDHEIHLDIVGVISDELYFDRLKRLISKYQLYESVVLHSNQTRTNVLNLLRKAEVFVLHTQEESQGIVFCEAMAAGKPIISTNVGGVPWVVKNGINGFLCDYSEISCFKKNVLELVGNQDLIKSIGAQNITDAQKYHWWFIEQDVIQVYDKLMYK